MSFANQPSRLLISSDDLSYGVGNSFTCVLPEPITGAIKADLLRAVIPNTGYQLPPYQNTFYYYLGTSPTVLRSFVIDTQQYFDSIPATNATYGIVSYFPLITYLNTVQSVLTFGWDYKHTRVTVAVSAGGTLKLAPSSAWALNTSTRAFALNTRLGFIDDQAGVLATTITGSIMGNLIRSKVVYVLCNVVMNDSITTDGLRTAIGKIPVNSTYGGLTIYQPPMLNWNRLITQGSYQQITISLLDDQYQPYPLNINEFCEFELCFKYDDIEDARMGRMTGR